jgi:hypothetical protein
MAQSYLTEAPMMIRSTRKVAHAGDVEMLELKMCDDRPGFQDTVLYVVGVLGVEPRLFNHEAAARAHMVTLAKARTPA